MPTLPPWRSFFDRSFARPAAASAASHGRYSKELRQSAASIARHIQRDGNGAQRRNGYDAGRIRFDLDPNNHSYRVQNLTGFDWRNGLLLGRNNGTVVAAWLGSMPEGSVHLVEPCEPAQDVFPERRLQLDSGDEGDNPINIFPLWKIAASTQSLGEGDWRLIATRHGEIEGVEIRPHPASKRRSLSW